MPADSRVSPKRLVILDHNENSLTYLGLELRENHPRLDVVQVVGDIKDEVGMKDLLTTQEPQIVFHAAAHKHVNLLEAAPREAILNNVMGTRNVARACEATGVETLVLISTDKAVNPTSVMGASKRVCEMLLQAMSGQMRTTMVAVRFGNVIGSEGSVLPIFRRQLARGGPLTVTHPDARRYFMTIPEASQLVIQAALLGQSGDVFILDMGEPVRILDVARQLIRLNGLEPDRDVRIEFIGLRPGEKLEEELLTRTERTRTTRHSKILQCELPALDTEAVLEGVERIIGMAPGATPVEIRAALRTLVPEYKDTPPPPLPTRKTTVAETLPSRHAPTVEDAPGKRTLDVLAASVSLALLAIPTALVWGLVHIAGPSSVAFRAERRIGTNRRHQDRRASSGSVGIDRRYTDRRQADLPGRPFVTYRIELEPQAGTSRLQQRLAGWIRSNRIDRVLYLWNVLRGDMSLVGPSAHLTESDSWRGDTVSIWCFARRPGLTGPRQILGGEGEEALLFDRYYGRHGSWRLDIDALRRSLPRLLRPGAPVDRQEDWSRVPASASRGEGERA